MIELIHFAASLLGLLAGHVVVFLLSLYFFNISSKNGQIILGLLMFFLFISTLLASYIIHKKDNFLTRFYYIGSVLWIGVFINLCLSIGLIIILKLLGPWLGWRLSLDWQHFIFFGGTIILSVVGIYRALVPKLTTYEVFIKDLPDAWADKTVVQISDVHLGPVYRRKFFYRLIDRVNLLEPEAVFITGDLFDGMESEFSWLNHPFTRLKAPRGIYYSFGNHDLYLGFSRVKQLLKENPIHILDNRMMVVDDLQIIGINYSFDNGFNLERAILKQVGYMPERASILLFHAPKNTRLARKVGIDLQLSGHTHDGQMFPYNLLTKWVHRGYGYGFFKRGDFNLIVNSGVGTWGPPMRTAARGEIVKIILRKKRDKVAKLE